MELETVNVAAKLTMNTLGWPASELEGLVKPGDKPKVIAQVFCMISGMKEKPSRFDATTPDTQFLGQFEGVNEETGDTVRAGSAYFPKAVAQWLKGLYSEAAEAAKKDGESEVKLPAMRFEITVQHDPHPNSAQGYKFGCRALVEKKVDPFAELRKLPTVGKGKKIA